MNFHSSSWKRGRAGTSVLVRAQETGELGKGTSNNAVLFGAGNRAWGPLDLKETHNTGAENLLSSTNTFFSGWQLLKAQGNYNFCELHLSSKFGQNWPKIEKAMGRITGQLSGIQASSPQKISLNSSSAQCGCSGELQNRFRASMGSHSTVSPVLVFNTVDRQFQTPWCRVTHEFCELGGLEIIT